MTILSISNSLLNRQGIPWGKERERKSHLDKCCQNIAGCGLLSRRCAFLSATDRELLEALLEVALCLEIVLS